MVAPRALALLPLSLQTMPVTPSNSSTATTGKAAHLRSGRIASQVRDRDSVVAVALALAVASEEASEVVEDLEAVVASEEVLEAVVVLVVDMVEPRPVVSMRERLLLLPTPSQTLPLLERREARLFMFAT
jgi:hypothetical protein